MKLGINQPYFFPYIGHWQLINAVDEFLLFDDVQYIRHGWINRNRILKEVGWAYITLPLKKHSRDSKIKEIQLSEKIELSSYVLNHLVFYKNRAPFYNEAFDLVQQALSTAVNRNIVDINENIIVTVAQALGIKTKIGVCSRYNFDYSEIKGAGDWPVAISKQMHASEYINPISHQELYKQEKFAPANLKLSFIRPKQIRYDQVHDRFEPDLSIIDVLMFNGIEGTKRFLTEFDLVDG